MNSFYRSWIWLTIGALAAWDVLRLLPVPSDHLEPEASRGVLEPPDMALQGGAVVALLAVLASWRLYRRVGGEFLDDVNWSVVVRGTLAGAIAGTALFADLGLL